METVITVSWSKFCRQMATMVERYAGDHCKKLGLSIDQFYRAITCPRAMKITNIKKGPIYELSVMCVNVDVHHGMTSLSL